MKFHELPPISRPEAERLLASKSEEEVGVTLIRLALHDPDPKFVEDLCVSFASDSRVWVRRNCATCFGHIARLHGELDLSRVMPILLDLSRDDQVAGWAEAALDDIEIFIGPTKH